MIYAKPAANTLYRIWLHNVNDGRHFAVTTDRFDSYNGTFSPDGEWIYFSLRPPLFLAGAQPLGIAAARAVLRPADQDLHARVERGSAITLQA